MAENYNIFSLKELQYVVQLFDSQISTKKAYLIKEIIKANYTVDEVRIEIETWEANPNKGRLEKYFAEKARKLDREERIRLAEISARSQEGRISRAESEIHSIDYNMGKFLQPFQNGDISLFLKNFERTCNQLGISKESWVIRLSSVLSAETNEVIARMSDIDSDYDMVKKI